jgi:hypothetical protein
MNSSQGHSSESRFQTRPVRPYRNKAWRDAPPVDCLNPDVRTLWSSSTTKSAPPRAAGADPAIAAGREERGRGALADERRFAAVQRYRISSDRHCALRLPIAARRRQPNTGSRPRVKPSCFAFGTRNARSLQPPRDHCCAERNRKSSASWGGNRSERWASSWQAPLPFPCLAGGRSLARSHGLTC